MAENKIVTFKIANVPVSIMIEGKRVLGGIINNKIKFDVIRAFPLKLKFESFVRDIPKENFLDLYKRIGMEIRKLKGVKPKTPAKSAARKSKKKSSKRKRCGAKKKK